jgi:hypothetical protein
MGHPLDARIEADQKAQEIGTRAFRVQLVQPSPLLTDA